MMTKPDNPLFKFRVALGVARVEDAVAVIPQEMRSPLGIATAHAIQQASTTPGCLVRVYYRSPEECVGLLDRVWGGLTRVGLLDALGTEGNAGIGEPGKATITIELTNGSGIELVPDPDVPKAGDSTPSAPKG